MLKIIHWLEHEILSLTPVIIYFLVCFSLLHFAQSLLMQPGDVHYTNYVGAMIGAILAGKVIFIAQKIPFINSFASRPLIYNVSWKFFVYSVFVLLFQIVEHFMHKFYATDSLSTSYKYLVLDLDHARFWGLQILVLMIFFIFTVFSELLHVIGRKQMRKIFFG